MNLPALVIAVFLIAMVSTGHAQQPPIPQSEVDAAVLKFQSSYAAAFNRRDAKAMADLLTENATLQTERGSVTHGREKIESLVGGLMTHLPAGAKLEDTPLISQAITPDVIVSQGISHRIVPGAQPVEVYFTRVLVREEDGWKLAATQIAQSPTLSAPAAN